MTSFPNFFFFFFFRFIYLFISACFLLGLCCCPQTFSSCHKQEWLFIAAHAFIALASLAAERVLGTWPSAVAARRLSICGAAFWSVFWPPCLSRACSHPTFSPWRRCVLAQSRSHQPPESSFGSLPAGFQREGLWERIVWEQHGSDDEKSAPGGQPEECSWPEEQVQSSELQKHLAIPRERKKSRRGAWREEAGRATDELAVPLDISRTPVPVSQISLWNFWGKIICSILWNVTGWWGLMKGEIKKIKYRNFLVLFCCLWELKTVWIKNGNNPL